MTDIRDGSNYAPSADAPKVVRPGEFQFAAAFLDHGHIYGQVNGLRDAGGTLRYVYDPDPGRVAAFRAVYPEVVAVDRFDAILAAPDIVMVAAAAVPKRRADIGIDVLGAGKDYFTDKSPFTTLAQLHRVRRTVAETGRRYMTYFAERLHNEAAWHAGEMLEAGAIGRVLQVVNLAPHRLDAGGRPAWFFQKDTYGGILTDIGSHQVEQFLSYAGCRDASIEFARACNLDHPEFPELEDFGEMLLTGDNGAAFYARVDWFTPGGQAVWGDGRTFVIGTSGSIEIRKYEDVARAAPASKLYIVDGDGEREIDCGGTTGYPFFGALILDTLARSEHAMTQEHVFRVAEISMQAQLLADKGRGAR
jgi:predicted dehydrogenase